MSLLRHCKVFCEIIILASCSFRSLVLLVSFFLVLHVVKCTSVPEVFILLFIVVRTTRFRFSGVSRVHTYVFDVIIDLAKLLVDLLIQCTISVVLDHPLVLLVRSDLYVPSLVNLRP